MSKSLEELQREYEENTVKLEQEKRKLRRTGKPKILSGQRFPQTAQPSADYPWGGD